MDGRKGEGGWYDYITKTCTLPLSINAFTQYWKNILKNNTTLIRDKIFFFTGAYRYLFIDFNEK